MTHAHAGRRWLGYAQAALACVATAALTVPLLGVLDAANIVMIFLLMVALVAMRLGSGPAVLAAFGGVGLFDFFFVPPRFSMVVADAQYLITFTVMLVVALVIGQLGARLREKALLASAREDETRALYDMAKELSGAITAGQVADIVRTFLRRRLDADAFICLPDARDALHAMPALPGDAPCPDPVRAVYAHGRPLSLAAGEGGQRPALALPLASPVRTRGVLLVSAASLEPVCTPEQRPLLDAVASLAAIAVERLHYSEVAQDVMLKMESERLRSALLSAVSHDLRTPLTVLVGLADTLTLASAGLPAASRESAVAIRDQALRLSGLVHKLLDMARLQTGKVVLNREWQPLEEVVGASLQAMAGVLGRRAVMVELAPDLPPLHVDAVLLERVFCNLLENAVKYAPQGPLRIQARRLGAVVEVTVADTGPGIPAGSEERIFDLFERGPVAGTAGGVGLGLAICRAIVVAHGGSLRAENLAAGGLAMRFSLPVGEPPPLEDAEHE